MADHFLTTEHAKRVDAMLRWYDRLGKRLRLTVPKAEGPPFGGGHPVHIGKLDAALSTTNSTGVKMTVWTTDVPPIATSQKISSVTSSTLLTGGTLASGESVEVGLVDGKWKVVGGGEEITVLTDFRVDTTTTSSGANTLQVKTRTIRVMPTAAGSTWTTIHTGTVCSTVSSSS